MPKKILAIAVSAVVALAIGLTAMVYLKKQEPTEAEIRTAIASALPKDATIGQLSFAVFPADRASGRVSVKGTFSFNHDLFSLPTPPLILMKSLSQAQIYDRDLSDWWAENSSYYPQFKGQLGEFQKNYASGTPLEFSGELPYMAIVDGTKVDGAGIVYKPLDGTTDPNFGYATDDDAKVKELVATIVEWRDRRRDKAAADAAAAAKAAEEQAAAAAKAQAAQAAADAAAAAAAEAARIAAIPPLVQAKGETCGGRYKDLKGCESVVFDRENLKYDAFPDVGFCSVADPISGVDSTVMGGGQMRYTPKTIGVRVRFFELKEGETFAGFTCGR